MVLLRYPGGITQPSNFNPERIPEIIEQTHTRLQRVQIESLPYERILEKYDRLTTFFYLDCPYWGRALYKFNFQEEDFVALERRLHQIKGKFILSLNDHPHVRRLYRGFRIQSMAVAYTAQHRPGKRYGELLIMNYRPRSHVAQSTG